MNRLLKDFRDFIARGNVLDLAVAVIVGIAFNAVINSMVNDVLMQIIAAIAGKPNFNSLTFSLGEGIIYYGRFLTALINFLIIAGTMFVVVRIFETLQRVHRPNVDDKPEELKSNEVILLGEIRDLLRSRS